MKNEEKNKNKKKILIIGGVVLLLIIAFLLWFFNRKFDVTFDCNNGSKEETIKVKYNRVIDEEDIKTSEELGEKFINWFEVKEVKDGKDVLEEKAFDFKTKIKKNIKLKAIYDGKVETITISFNTDGGSKVDSIILNKGSKLSLPGAPSKNGYNFLGWYYANGSKVENNTAFNEDATLFAKWKKVETTKPVEKPVEEPKPEPTPEPTPAPKEEQISLSLSKTLLHRNGNNKSKATASTENVDGNVTYSVNSNCVSIDKNTGDITAAGNDGKCKRGTTVVVTATTPKGKTATKELTIEPDLFLTERDNIINENSYRVNATSVTVVSNIDVTWNVSCAEKNSMYKYTQNVSLANTRASFDLKCSADNGSVTTNSISLVVSTPAGQSRTIKFTPTVN